MAKVFKEEELQTLIAMETFTKNVLEDLKKRNKHRSAQAKTLNSVKEKLQELVKQERLARAKKDTPGGQK